MHYNLLLIYHPTVKYLTRNVDLTDSIEFSNFEFFVASSRHSSLFTYMSQLWLDKHRPHTLAKLTFHPDITSKLTALAGSDEVEEIISHFLREKMFYSLIILSSYHICLFTDRQDVGKKPESCVFSGLKDCVDYFYLQSI